MDKTKRSWYIAKLYKNAAVEDLLGNYTLFAGLFQLNTTVLQLHLSQQDIKVLFYGVNY